MGERYDECHIQGSTDRFICLLQVILRFSVRVLAVLMTFVILWGILDVIWVLYQRLLEPPFMLLQINDILATFGAFMAVLIAIEIFANIVMYLQSDIIHIRLVLATALMAAARKVIVLDFTEVASTYVFALAAIIISLGISYWLLTRRRYNARDDNAKQSLP
ncbi:MAG: phosphate-starvation-inducible PsiE family protein [Desulfocurvibacter africanus]